MTQPSGTDRSDLPVLVDVSDGIGVVTMNRPNRRNAINQALRRGVQQAVADLDADPAVRVIVLTGADPAFCAGLDLNELGDGGGNRRTFDSEAPVGSSNPFGSITTPLIGAVNGVAITGGFELALNCDFLIASERAAFADTHARVGVMPGWGLTPLLVDAVGVRRAREMSLSGNFVDAATALTWGLVNRVVPHGELMDVTLGIARDIAGNDPAGVTRMLATYAEQEDSRLADSWRIEGDAAHWFKQAAGYDASTVAERRAGIIERGRTQV